jgi:hypothetical protein
LIETKLKSAGGTLVMPPFKQSGQFTKEQNDAGYKCASARIHVERCIERMKRFKILDFFPHHMLKHCDTILVTIAGLCNLLPNLIRDDKPHSTEFFEIESIYTMTQDGEDIDYNNY